MMPELFEVRRWLRGRKLPSFQEDSIIDPDFALRIEVAERIDLKRRKLWKAAQDIVTLHSESFTGGVLPFFFEHCGRLAATLHVETRHPFSDRRVIEFFLSLPLKMETYSPLPKRVIRAGMEGALPEMVRSRTLLAHPGGAFLSSLLSRQPELLEPAKLKRVLGAVQRYVSLDAVELDRNRVAIGFSDAGDAVWQALSLALWLGSRNFPIG